VLAEEKGLSLVVLRKNHLVCPGQAQAGHIEEALMENHQSASATVDHFLLAAAGSMKTAKIIFGFMYVCRFCGQTSFDRPAAVLAKQLNSIDVSSKGRARLFLNEKVTAMAIGPTSASDGETDDVDQNEIQLLIGFLSGKVASQGLTDDEEIDLKPRYEHDDFQLPLGIYFEGRPKDGTVPPGYSLGQAPELSLGPVDIDSKTFLTEYGVDDLPELSLAGRDMLYFLPDAGQVANPHLFSLNHRNKFLSWKTVFDFQDNLPEQIMSEIKHLKITDSF